MGEVMDNAVHGAGAVLAIDVISDAICPWCWIGKRRLDRAIAMLAPEITASVTWRPFELNPGMPREGVDRRAYRTAKFGSWEHSQALDARVAAAGRTEGLAFHHDRMERTPNTIDAHRVIRLAGEHGRQHEVVEALFVAYFNEGRDIGDRAVLADVAASAGLDHDVIRAMLASNDGEADVRAELRHTAGLQISGVPTVLVDGVPLFSGAISPDHMADELRQAAGRLVLG